MGTLVSALLDHECQDSHTVDNTLSQGFSTNKKTETKSCEVHIAFYSEDTNT